MHLLAQAMPAIPAPPPTDSIVEWIAVALVIVVVASVLVGVPWIVRRFDGAQERALTAYAEQAEADRALFREQLDAERRTHAAAVESVRAEHERQVGRLHDRLDSIHDAITRAA